MSVTQYIGARYVPLFADPLAWDITQQYEPLTIVYYQGNSYTSKQAVPANIDISNTDYWVITGNYNAQIEQYRQEVTTYDNRITANTTSNTAQDAQLAGTTSSGLKTLIEGNASDISDIESDISSLEDADDALSAQLAGTSSSGLKTLIETNASDISDIDTTLTGFDTTNQVKTYIDNAILHIETKKKMLVIGDSLSGSTYVAANARWCVKLANYLDADLFVFQANGAGYAEPGVSGHTFQTLINAAHSSLDFDDADIDYVFIFGGTNDISEGMLPAATTTAFDATLNLARQYFAKAELYICSPTTRYDHLKLVSANRRGEIYQLKAWRLRPSIANNNAVILPLTFVTGFNESYYVGGESDHIHLNASGHTKVANAIYTMMKGVPIGSFMSCQIQNPSGTNVGLLRCAASANGLQVFGYLTSAAGSDSYIHDEFLILKDAGFDNYWNGAAVTGTNGGYLGAYSDAQNGLHAIGYGGINVYIPLT